MTLCFISVLVMLCAVSGASAIQDTVIQKIYIQQGQPTAFWWLNLLGVVITAISGFLQSNPPKDKHDKKQ
jgi:hypothetical protein